MKKDREAKVVFLGKPELEDVPKEVLDIICKTFLEAFCKKKEQNDK